MATTTPNFGWSVPTSTDLVKDGATAIETLGDSIDASLVDLKGGTTGQVLAKASSADMDFVWSADAAGMTNPMTTTGDTIYSSSGSTPARLGIGTTGQLLTVAGGVPTWAAPPAGGGMTLLSTTTLTGASVTVSSISQSYKNLYILFKNPLCATNGTAIAIQFNADSTANRHAETDSWVSSNTFSKTFAWVTQGNVGNLNALGLVAVNLYDYTNTTTRKFGNSFGLNADSTTGNDARFAFNMMAYNQTSAITSMAFRPNGGNWTSGSVLIYGVN